MKQRLSFLFVLTILVICAVAGATEEALWCEFNFEEPEVIPRSFTPYCYDAGNPCCDRANDVYGQCLSQGDEICQQVCRDFLYSYYMDYCLWISPMYWNECFMRYYNPNYICTLYYDDIYYTCMMQMDNSCFAVANNAYNECMGSN